MIKLEILKNMIAKNYSNSNSDETLNIEKMIAKNDSNSNGDETSNIEKHVPTHNHEHNIVLPYFFGYIEYLIFEFSYLVFCRFRQ